MAPGLVPLVSRVLLTIVALAATAVLGGATSADAAVLGAQTTCDKYMSCSYVVSYTADPGERNDVRIVRRESALAVSDSGAAIRAGAGCTGAGSQLVTCVFADPVARIRVDTGDGADRVDAAALDNGTRAIVDGGTGDDTLIGSAFEDTLTGGSGNDTIDGGGGTDTASFDERRRARLRVDLRTGIATAAGGERDTLARVANLRGGSGDDVLIGDGGTNDLTGGGGEDELRGREGADALTGGGRLDGGAGDDLIRLAGHGRAICGAGAGDLVAASGTASIVDDSCEGLRLPGVTVRLHLAQRDPARDAISIPVLGLLAGDTLDARLTARATHTVLGQVHRAITCELRCSPARLRFSAGGASRVRRSAPLEVVFRLKTSRARTFGGAVRLRIGRTA
jgi:Ca2+-binding RTX toxin-like protein